MSTRCRALKELDQVRRLAAFRQLEECLEYSGAAKPPKPLPNTVPVAEIAGKRTPGYAVHSKVVDRFKELTVVTPRLSPARLRRVKHNRRENVGVRAQIGGDGRRRCRQGAQAILLARCVAPSRRSIPSRLAGTFLLSECTSTTPTVRRATRRSLLRCQNQTSPDLRGFRQPPTPKRRSMNRLGFAVQLCILCHPAHVSVPTIRGASATWLSQ
jgi:hypothetical protein